MWTQTRRNTIILILVSDSNMLNALRNISYYLNQQINTRSVYSALKAEVIGLTEKIFFKYIQHERDVDE